MGAEINDVKPEIKTPNNIKPIIETSDAPTNSPPHPYYPKSPDCPSPKELRDIIIKNTKKAKEFID